MKLKIVLALGLVLTLLFGLVGVKKVLASSFNLSGRITDSSGNGISGAEIIVKDTATNISVTNTTSNGSGNYAVGIPGGTYDVSVTPPLGSNYGPVIAPSYMIRSDTSINFVLVPAGALTFSGHVYDSLGVPVPNVRVYLSTPTIDYFPSTAVTNLSGEYFLQAPTGTYFLHILTDPTGIYVPTTQPSVSPFFQTGTPNYVLDQSKVIDFTLPFKKVDVHVSDALNNPITGVEIRTNRSGGSWPIGGGITDYISSGYDYGPKTDSGGNVTLWLIANGPNSSYAITATPSNGSSFVATSSTIIVTNDTQTTITLPQIVTFSGHVYGALGDPLPGQRVMLENYAGIQYITYTDTSGSYSMQAPIDRYRFLYLTSRDPISSSLNAPEYYNTNLPNFILSQSTIIDFTIPAKKVSVHIQDALNNPVGNVSVGTDLQGSVVSIGGGLSSYVVSAYGAVVSEGAPTTDSSGNVTLWLIPGTYKITATPPSGGIYQAFTVSNVQVTQDQTEIISLQYNHTVPVTTSSLSTQNSDGTYADPTIVTLSATAATGYSISNIYYTIDGGSKQTYLAPFSVLGSGSHTITYWSVDNVGVQESPNTKTFTIHTNQPPVVGAIPNSTINEGDAYSFNGSFVDADSTSWTGTINYGDGSGVQTLAISGNTFTLNHVYKDNGIYTVTVSITDNQGATGTATAIITVNNVAPTVDAITVSPTGPQIINTLINASANFTDPGVLDTHTAVWSWGDGSIATNGIVTETNGSGSVTGSHTYTSAGVYTVVLTVTDKDGGIGTSQYQYIVIYDPSAGFVTGGGVSNDGSIFGISAKYTSTNSTPTGNTGYTFNGGNSVFASTSYNWLVVSGTSAFLSGQGTINGTGQYNFLVSATDGVPDMLRFKITDLSGIVVYDNQSGAADTVNPTQAIIHGQIKIH